MRSTPLLLLVALAACDTAGDRPPCPSPLDTTLEEGEAALTRKSSLGIGYDCPPVVRGRATAAAGAVVVATELDTLRLQFDGDGSLSRAEYARGDDWEGSSLYDRWSVSGPRSGSFEPESGRGRFEVAVFNNSLFPVTDTLRGQFRAAVLGGA